MADWTAPRFGVRMELGWRTLGKLTAPLKTSQMRDLALALVHRAVHEPDTWAELLAVPARHKAALVLPHRGEYLPLSHLLVREPIDRLAAADPERLGQVIEVLDSMLSGPPRARAYAEPPTTVGAQVFEELLNRFARVTPVRFAMPTPPSVDRLAVGLARPGPGSRVYAPVADFGMMLAAAAADLRYRLLSAAPESDTLGDFHAVTRGHRFSGNGDPIPDVRFVGRAHSTEAMMLAALHMDITRTHGRIRTTPLPPSATEDTSFDVVLTAQPWDLKRWAPDHLADTEWAFGDPPEHTPHFAWLQHSWSRLPVGGRAVVAMPMAAGRSRIQTELGIRAAMLDAGVVEAVIEMPFRMYGTAYGLKSFSLWLLDNRGPDRPPREDVLFIDASALGVHGYGKRIEIDAHSARIVKAVTEFRRGRGPETEPGFCAVVSRTRLAEGGHDLTPSRHTVARTRSAEPSPASASPPIRAAAGHRARIAPLRRIAAPPAPRRRPRL